MAAHDAYDAWRDSEFEPPEPEVGDDDCTRCGAEPRFDADGAYCPNLECSA